MSDAISLFGTSSLPHFTPGHFDKTVSLTSYPAATAPLSQGEVIFPDDPRIAILGGEVSPFGPNWPSKFYTTTWTFTGATGLHGGLGGRIEFATTAASFDIRMLGLGPSSDFSLFVDGAMVEDRLGYLPGGEHWVHVELGRKGKDTGWKTIEFEFQGGADIGQLVLSPGGEIAATHGEEGPRVVFLGDSITAAPFRASAGEGWAAIAARNLGIHDRWISAEGGTGYAATLMTHPMHLPSLAERIEIDGVAARGDLYIVAMGINDQPGIYDEAVDVFAALTQGCPGARVIVLTSWNPTAPGPSIKPGVDAEIRAAAALFPQITVIDAGHVAFTTADGTHPDAAGNWSIAEWFVDALGEAMQIDGAVARGVAGDVVGPLFLDNYDPAQHYSYTIYEDGAVTHAWEVIETGDAFPLLKLAEGQAVQRGNEVTLTIEAHGDHGADNLGTVTFDVLSPGKLGLKPPHGASAPEPLAPAADLLFAQLAPAPGHDWLPGHAALIA